MNTHTTIMCENAEMWESEYSTADTSIVKTFNE